MKIPSMCVENFFQFPDDLVKLSESENIEYSKGKYGHHPGWRSEQLEDKYPSLCKFITIKVLSQIYDVHGAFRRGEFNIDVKDTQTYFMRVPFSHGKGIVHTDTSTITTICFLNKDLNGCGTSILRRNSFFAQENAVIAQNKRIEHFKSDVETPEWIDVRDNHNSNYTEVMRTNGDYNSSIIFNGYLPHCMNMDTDPKDGDRISLIQFIEGISAPESPDQRFELVKPNVEIF